MRIILNKFVGGVVCSLLLLLALGFIGLERAEAENIIFKIITINPSKTKTQAVQVRKYLPEEVGADDIVNLSGLKLEYDSEKSLYYVYRKDITLAPAEVRTYNVEVKDVWLVPLDRLSDLEERTDSILARLESKEYYEKAKILADSIYRRLNEIKTSQTDELISREQHIGVYRQNLITLADIKEDVARMEKILVTAGGPPAPEMLEDAKIKSDSPSKTMAWIVIFSIIVFTGLLAGVLFFTWHRQANVTKSKLAEDKKAAFPGSESKADEESKGEQS